MPSDELKPLYELLEVLLEIQTKAEMRADEILREREVQSGRCNRREGAAIASDAKKG